MTDTDTDNEANFAVGGGLWGKIKIHTPVHESLTLAALMSAEYSVSPGTTLATANNQDWEFIRGVVWNDDPAWLLFDDTFHSNHSYSTGVQWGWYYQQGEHESESARMVNPTGRSHYGDLQFLHCMASKMNEPPLETKSKLMTWIEVMWKLANGEGGINPESIIKETALGSLCPDGSLPYNGSPLRTLLAGESEFKELDIQKRALGSIFHFIQDSYSLGHTRRTLLNPEKKVSEKPLQFEQGVADRWGAIECFHVYNGQNESHEFYDHATHPIPSPNNLADVDQFNYMIGCRDAVDKCIDLIKLKKMGKTWDTGVGLYLDTEVFPLAANARPADNHVWP